MKNSSKSVTSILSQKEGHFGALIRRADALSRLSKQVDELLPPHLKGKCQVANIRDNQIIFTCNSASWATHLHHEQRQLLSRLAVIPEYAQISSIRVKIAPHESTNKNQHQRIPRNPGTTALTAIDEFSEELEDSDLKRAFARLSQTLKKT
ncbi:MAG: DUF721 domain-containing protein [Gammaproteobacteria bacterium]|nr:DUF721 domain-containing protein [Gammaproteobacteria bacterium]